MSQFKSLDEVFDGRLALPGKNGKIYHVPEPDRELGLWCTAMIAAGLAVNMGEEPPREGMPPLQLDDTDEAALYRRVLGPVWEELRRDGYGFATQRLFAQTGFIWIGAGEAAAMEFWNNGGVPKASTPPRDQRRHPDRAPSSSSTPSTAAASTTQPPASTSTTRRRRRR